MSTSLVPVVSSQLAPTNNSEFVPPEWAHLISSVRVEWVSSEINPYWPAHSIHRSTGRCRIYISMALDFGIVSTLEDKLRNGLVVKGSGLVAIVQSMSINHVSYGPGPSLDVVLEGWRE